MDYKYTIQALNIIGEQVVQDMGNILIKRNKLATKRLYNSIDYYVDARKGRPTLNFSYLSYGEYVRGNPRWKSKQPPVQAIMSWLVAKKIPIGGGKERNIGNKNLRSLKNEDKLKAMAWRISKTIKKRGYLNPNYNPVNFIQPSQDWQKLKYNQELLKKALIQDLRNELKKNK